jgi:hypothetical protein
MAELFEVVGEAIYGAEKDELVAANSCAWCLDPEQSDADHDTVLCEAHEAEYRGCTINQLYEREDFE